MDPAAIPEVITDHLRTQKSSSAVEVAFYGGTFTALPLDQQRGYLDTVQPFIRDNRVRAIRISTRPDCISTTVLDVLKAHTVATVELGVQSMDDAVLALAGRGHTAADTRAAAATLKAAGFQIGMQLMPGLPGDSRATFMRTIAAVCELQPDFVRLYPALVIADTPLADRFLNGRYTPLELDEAVSLCRDAHRELEQGGVKVIRMGLQANNELNKAGTVLAGPYHPAFRQLVDSAIMLDNMRNALLTRTGTSKSAVFCVNPRDLSAAAGQHRTNITLLKKEFDLQDIRLRGDEACTQKRAVHLIVEEGS